MTNVRTSATTAVANVFDAIGTTATAATKLVTGVATGADTFERMMLDMDQSHADRSVLHRSTYRENLLVEQGIANAKLKLETKRILGQDPELLTNFNEQYAKLEALFAPKEA